MVPQVLSGEKISALAVTEPGGGSDVANLQTRAVREGDFYRVSGSKTFITSGVRADFYTVAVRTGEPGFAGISLLLIEKGTPGFTVGRPLKKMGWWASDTAELFFDDCQVPVGNLIGSENMGFACIMGNFQSERLALALDGQHDRAAGLGGEPQVGARSVKPLASRSASSRCSSIAWRRWPRHWKSQGNSPTGRRRKWRRARA